MENISLKALEESERILLLVNAAADILIQTDMERNYLSVIDILQYIKDEADKTRILVTEALIQRNISAV